MLSEKLAMTLTEKQLRQLISMQGKTANKNLRSIRTEKVENLSGAYIKKTAPYLNKYSTKSGKNFRVSMPSNASKKQLVNALLNIQYFNEKIGTAEKVKAKAQHTADEYGIDIEDTAKFWDLVRAGFDSVGYRVDSDSILKIVSERLRNGQSARGIKVAITRAANAAESGDDFISKFSKGGKWL